MRQAEQERDLAALRERIGGLGLTPSRRLQLAAEQGGGLALVIRRWRGDAASEPSAAATRWRILAAPSPPLPVPGLARARWTVELVRARGAEPRTWLLEAPDA